MSLNDLNPKCMKEISIIKDISILYYFIPTKAKENNTFTNTIEHKHGIYFQITLGNHKHKEYVRGRP